MTETTKQTVEEAREETVGEDDSRAFHVITGLPRACSTLLQALIQQNPEFFVSSTSELAAYHAMLVRLWSSSVDFRADLGRNREEAEAWTRDMIRSCTRTYHSRGMREDGKENARVIFDKSRMWTLNPSMLWTAYPNAVMIVCIRDLRDVVASCDRHYVGNGLLDGMPDMIAKSPASRLDMLFNQEGLIGNPLVGISGMIQRGLIDGNGKSGDPRVIVVKAEDWTESGLTAKRKMEEIYDAIGEDYWAGHNYTDFEFTAKDADHQTLFKFPHTVSGPVGKGKQTAWDKSLAGYFGDFIVRENWRFFLEFDYATLEEVDEIMEEADDQEDGPRLRAQDRLLMRRAGKRKRHKGSRKKGGRRGLSNRNA